MRVISSKRNKIYALYKGDQYLGMGTIEELAKEFGKKPEMIRYYGTNANKRRNEKRGTFNYLCLVDTDLPDEEETLIEKGVM